MLDLTVVVLTHNEERHIARALESVRAIARELLVVDSGSTDRTVPIAASFGARVLTHPFVNQARQCQWALDEAGIGTRWVLRLDADEYLGRELADEIARRLPALPEDVAGVRLKRRHVFLGRWIRHGGRYPLRLLRLWRCGQGRVEDRWMDEHVVVQGGRTIDFEHDFTDHNLGDLGYFIDKHNRYATREAVEVLNQRHRLFARDDAVLEGSGDDQAAFKRRLKERVYNRIPYPLSSTAYFLFRYLVQLGFLDGRAGLVYHALQGGWYRFLVGAKVAELEAQLLPIDDKAAALETLRRLTGLKLEEAAA
ncbi:MAG TPA: glycosyltransferase family 2 protein [Methylibium sp.]|uniref:glycosyltransferase family 2 protein n=1 Tax=Methylibium sp. TaxID=2067992 RepID=UPI002DBAB4D3|nr:glycosyltransferase family 2 protein [Methylibium sp.]HEU4459529.1 glycosyltransferase family 2 protein [Methylibium sp.]